MPFHHAGNYVDDDGRIVLYTHDSGPGVEQFFGRDEVEAWYRIRPADTRRFVSELAAHVGAEPRRHSLSEGLRLIELGLESGAFRGKGSVGDWAERHDAEVQLTVI